jgi:Fe-S-cluster containining protein
VDIVPDNRRRMISAEFYPMGREVSKPMPKFPAADNSPVVAMSSGQDCRQCGKCCEKWGWDQKGIPEDLVPWIRERRTDILQHVRITFSDGRCSTGQDLSLSDIPFIRRIDYWVDPHGRKLTYCPFFFRAGDGKVYCRIHMCKPAVCIGFTPWNEGIRDYALYCPACRDNAP